MIYNDLCTFEFGVATELFGLPRPELGIEWYDYTVVSIDAGPLQTVGGVTMVARNDLRIVEEAGTVVLPGWRDPGERPPTTLIDALRTAHARGARIMSICSGVFILAATGLLNGHSATTHWRYTELLRKMYPDIDVKPDVLYIDNGNTLTSAGSAAGLDLGLHLIRRDHGAEIANRVARRLVVPPHRDGGQAQFITTPVRRSENQTLSATLQWVTGNLNEPHTVADMAAHSHMAPRTFARRFRKDMGVSPHRWLTRQRVLLAQRLLETTTASIDSIAVDCGFGTAATLRHHFHGETHTTPTSYRTAFRG